MSPSPRLSIVVIAYRMSRQALNTAYSLSARHQRNVRESDYEIIVVENASDDNIPETALMQLGGNIRYLRRQETSQSPARAINAGLALCRGEFIGLMIDGARMLTPRTVEYTLMATRCSHHILVAVPSYNLGPQQQHLHLSHRYGEAEEIALLEKSRWQENGYRLFDIASIGDANSNGFLNPLLESNCFFSSAQNFAAIGGAQEAFDLPGGGSLNLHMFRQLGTLPGIRYFLLPGEGTFHQFHGGITTSEIADREEVLESHRRQLHSYWGGTFHSLRREPTLLGSVTSHAQRYLKYSSRKNQVRGQRRLTTGQALWQDDPADTHAGE